MGCFGFRFFVRCSSHQNRVNIVLFILCGLVATTITANNIDYDITCKDENGKAVDWSVPQSDQHNLNHIHSISISGSICINCQDISEVLVNPKDDCSYISQPIRLHRNGHYLIVPSMTQRAYQATQSDRPISMRPK